MAAVTAQPLDAQLKRVEKKLLAARKHDRGCRNFGAGKHGYRLGPPLSVSRIAAFEVESGVALPEDFRRFVTEVGNGGAGPAYGWPDFHPELTLYREPPWRLPFEAPREDDDDDDDYELTGYIEMSEHGCGIFDFLVVSGAERGNVWFSDDGGGLYPLPGRDWDSHAGLPLDFSSSVVWRQRLGDPANTSRLSFLDYFEGWLDGVLASAPGVA